MKTVFIRGQKFEAKHLIDIHLFNLVEPFNAGEIEAGAIAKHILEPVVQRRVAYALKAIFPDLTDDFAIYREILTEQGIQVKAQLNLTSEEIYQLITQLVELTREAVATEKQKLEQEKEKNH